MFTIDRIGTDTEVFLKDLQGKPVPVCGLIGGTKHRPRPLDKDGSALQEDNVMLEFNVIPAATVEGWVGNINKVLTHIIDELREKELVIDISASQEFTFEQLRARQAREMGCEPDFSAWSGEQNPPMNAATMRNIRTAGGHVHVSFSVNGHDPTMLQKMNVIRMLDLTLGVPSVLLDDDDRRRSYYGKAGAHRVKAKDRVEYRTLSNFWIKNDKLKEWVYFGVSDAMRRLNNLSATAEDQYILEGMREDIEEIIKFGNKDRAKALINTMRIRMP